MSHGDKFVLGLFAIAAVGTTLTQSGCSPEMRSRLLGDDPNGGIFQSYSVTTVDQGKVTFEVTPMDDLTSDAAGNCKVAVKYKVADVSPEMSYDGVDAPWWLLVFNTEDKYKDNPSDEFEIDPATQTTKDGDFTIETEFNKSPLENARYTYHYFLIGDTSKRIYVRRPYTCPYADGQDHNTGGCLLNGQPVNCDGINYGWQKTGPQRTEGCKVSQDYFVDWITPATNTDGNNWWILTYSHEKLKNGESDGSAEATSQGKTKNPFTITTDFSKLPAATKEATHRIDIGGLFKSASEKVTRPAGCTSDVSIDLVAIDNGPVSGVNPGGCKRKVKIGMGITPSQTLPENEAIKVLDTGRDRVLAEGIRDGNGRDVEINFATGDSGKFEAIFRGNIADAVSIPKPSSCTATGGGGGGDDDDGKLDPYVWYDSDAKDSWCNKDSDDFVGSCEACKERCKYFCDVGLLNDVIYNASTTDCKTACDKGFSAFDDNMCTSDGGSSAPTPNEGDIFLDASCTTPSSDAHFKWQGGKCLPSCGQTGAGSWYSGGSQTCQSLGLPVSNPRSYDGDYCCARAP